MLTHEQVLQDAVDCGMLKIPNPTRALNGTMDPSPAIAIKSGHKLCVLRRLNACTDNWNYIGYAIWSNGWVSGSWKKPLSFSEALKNMKQLTK